MEAACASIYLTTPSTPPPPPHVGKVGMTGQVERGVHSTGEARGIYKYKYKYIYILCVYIIYHIYEISYI